MALSLIFISVTLNLLQKLPRLPFLSRFQSPISRQLAIPHPLPFIFLLSFPLCTLESSSDDPHGIMVQRSASSSTALPRFLLSLSASSTSSQQLHGPANNADACSRIVPASSPDSACQSTSQDIELVAIHTWGNPSAAAPRIIKHKRASLSLPALPPSALPERKSAPGDKDLRLASPGSTASLEFLAGSTTDSLSRGMTPIERQNKANQVWRSYW